MSDSRHSEARTSDRILAGIQLLLPTHMISRVVHWAARVESGWFKRLLIGFFLRLFDIDMNEARIRNPHAYRSFNDFFTRALAPGARPLPPAEDGLASPVDGTVSQLGSIESGRIFQAKGHEYSVLELLGGDQNLASPFLGGHFATIYLAPYNYHRIHMPVGATLRDMVYVPGRLFSVSPGTVRAMPRLFARNERVACIFDSDAGPFALVAVGALNVGSIETVWAGEITPTRRRLIPRVEHSRYDHDEVQRLARGDEMGRFNLGSTVVLLFGAGAVEWEPGIGPAGTVRLGQQIGRFRRGA